MKTLMKNVLLLVLVLGLVACGKNSSGGGGSSTNSTTPVTNGDGNNTSNIGSTQTGSSQSINSIESLRQVFASKSMSEGLTANMAVYHVGPTYAGYSSGGFNIEVSGCINLIFWSAGDCDGYTQADYLNDIVDNGAFRIVKSTTNDQVVYDKATGVRNGDFTVSQKTFNRSSDRYVNMLGLNSTSYSGYGSKSVVSSANVKLSNGQQIEAYLVEHFSGYSTTRYVVSPKLPIFANPVAVLDSYGNFTGALKSVGNSNVGFIQVNLHTLNSYTGEAVTAGYNQLSL